MLEIVACVLITIVLCMYGSTNLYLFEYEYHPDRIRPYKQKYLATILYLIGMTETVTEKTVRSYFFKCTLVQIVAQVAFIILVISNK